MPTINGIQRLANLRKYLGNGLIREMLLRTQLRIWDIPIARKTLRHIIRPRSVGAPKWVFLIGSYNSGTTITWKILGSHPEVRVLPREGARIASDLPRPEDLGWTRMWIGCHEHMQMPEKGSDEILERILKDWSPWWDKGEGVFLEKSVTNITRMRWLDAHFENAYFIGIVRNGYCATEGILRRARPRGRARKLVGDAYPVEMAARQWVEANRAMLGGADKVRRYIQISYEALVENPIDELDKIWTYLGIERLPCSFKNGCLRLNRSKFMLRNMNDDSLSRLSDSDLKRINSVISAMQRALNYKVIRNAR